jgi:hypothetical protein
MPRLAGVGENAFQSANQSKVADRGAQLFLHLSDDGIVAPFAELNTTANRTKKHLLFDGIVKLVDQYFPAMMKDTERERTNAVFRHE